MIQQSHLIFEEGKSHETKKDNLSTRVLEGVSRGSRRRRGGGVHPRRDAGTHPSPSGGGTDGNAAASGGYPRTSAPG
jgi:hypothetical protein